MGTAGRFKEGASAPSLAIKRITSSCTGKRVSAIVPCPEGDAFLFAVPAEGSARWKTHPRSGIIPLEFMWEEGYPISMTTTEVIKDGDFELVTEAQKPDSKKRLSIGQALTEGVSYSIYRNGLGQIVLDPVVTIPASEAWLFKNKKALASVKRGLEDAAAGRTRNLGSFSKHAKE